MHCCTLISTILYRHSLDLAPFVHAIDETEAADLQLLDVHQEVEDAGNCGTAAPLGLCCQTSCITFDSQLHNTQDWVSEGSSQSLVILENNNIQPPRSLTRNFIHHNACHPAKRALKCISKDLITWEANRFSLAL